MKLYDDAFFDREQAGTLTSARSVLPVVVGLMQPQSVVDFGCGRGAWLSVCRELGVEKVLGMDGPYVDRAKLLIPQESFVQADLAAGSEVTERFDLAMCLEVAEHLPFRSAPAIVRSICQSADCALFSAAVPGQGGLHHINEQWPPFWNKLFEAEGFQRFDIVRPLIVADARVEWWYRQNIYMFARRDSEAWQKCAEAAGQFASEEIEFIHARTCAKLRTVRGLSKELLRTIWRTLRAQAA